MAIVIDRDDDPITPVASPTKARLLARGATKACPVCGQRRGLFRRWTQMVDDCPRCGLHFERIEGHWIGAIGINTIVSFGALLVTIIAGLLVTWPDPPTGALIAVAVAVSVVVPIGFHPFSRTLWTAIDIAMRPLEPHEIDWTVLSRPTPTDEREQ